MKCCKRTTITKYFREFLIVPPFVCIIKDNHYSAIFLTHTLISPLEFIKVTISIASFACDRSLSIYLVKL